jgi:hypothetical protein
MKHGVFLWLISPWLTREGTVKLKIKVMQYMYGDFEYFTYSEMIHRRYCQRYGYDYVRRDDMPRKDRQIHWHKVPVMGSNDMTALFVKPKATSH